MRRVNNKGFSKTEVIIMLTLILVLLAVGFKVVFDNSKNYSSFKTLANSFANDVSRYKDNYERSDSKYYLKDLVDKGYSEELRNPFDGSVKCDLYESFVEVVATNNKKITLKCGEYLLVGTHNEKYDLYEVSDWSETKVEEDYTDMSLLYNYTKDGKLVLDHYVTSDAFIEYFYLNEQQILTNIFDVDNQDDKTLLTKNMYREKTLIKEIK